MGTRKTKNILSGAVGLNNARDPVRIKYDPETGIGELAIAYNVNIGDNHRISRVKGFTATSRNESCHSLWPRENPGFNCFFVSGGSIYRLNPDYSRTGIRSGLTLNARMSYVGVSDGKNDNIYYTNGYELGIIRENISYPWEKGEYVGPETKKVFYDPPIGTLLEVYNGHMFVVQGNNVYYSEKFAYDRHRMLNLPFPHDITMFRAIDDGIYVGTEREIYFLNGEDPESFVLRRKADYGVIRGTDVLTNGDKIGKDSQYFGKVVVWTTAKGICLGAVGGQFKNLTWKNLRYPNSIQGAGLIVKDRYVCLLES